MMNRSRAGASLTPASVSRLMSQLPNVALPKMPATVSVWVVPFWNVTSTVEPTDAPRSFAGSLWSSTSFVPNPATVPSIRSGSTSLSKATGSTAPIALVLPSTCPLTWRMGVTASSSGTAARASLTVGDRPWNP